MKKLKITLKSDMCMGNGYSFAGVIDSDICYDENGLPYIPARRIKGCLRDVALLICENCNEVLSKEELEKIFGISGDNATKGVIFDNAYISDYEGITNQLNVYKKNNVNQTKNNVNQTKNNSIEKEITELEVQIEKLKSEVSERKSKANNEDKKIAKKLRKENKTTRKQIDALEEKKEKLEIKLENESQEQKEQDKQLNTEDEFNDIVLDINPKVVIDLFTSVKAQTKVKDGVSEENSLRFTRVLNERNPIDGEAMIFEANIDLDYLEADIVEKFELICKGLRHMGMSRNRGLGNVKCEILKEENNKNNKNIEKELKKEIKTIEDDKEYVIEYVFTNINPLVMSYENSNETELYIKGSNIQGALVREYLKVKENRTDISEDAKNKFDERFLKKNVKFKNAYLCEIQNEKAQSYEPAPLFLAKYKLGKTYVCQFEVSNKEKTNDSVVDTAKSMKDKFVNMQIKESKAYCNEKEALIDTTYHYRKENKKENRERQLYVLNSLAKNQYFKSGIIVKGKYLKEIYILLNKAKLSFGKSKSAEYGTCKLKNKYTKVYEKNAQKIDVKKDEEIVISLVSDAIFNSENGGYNVDFETVSALILSKLNEEYNTEWDICKKEGLLRCGQTNGYYGVWNMKQSSTPVIKAGSILVVKPKNDVSINRNNLFVGTRNNKGYGECKVYRYEEIKSIETLETEKNENKKLEQNKKRKQNKKREQNLGIIKLLKEKEEYNTIIKNIYINEKIVLQDISPSLLGRITLMLKESHYKKVLPESINMVDKNASIEEITKPKDILEEFEKRVNNIKREKERKEAQTYLEKVKDMYKTTEDSYILMHLKLALEKAKYNKKVMSKEEKSKLEEK